MNNSADVLIKIETLAEIDVLCTVAGTRIAIKQKNSLYQNSYTKGYDLLLFTAQDSPIYAVLAHSALTLALPATNPHAPIHPKFQPGTPPSALE